MNRDQSKTWAWFRLALLMATIGTIVLIFYPASRWTECKDLPFGDVCELLDFALVLGLLGLSFRLHALIGVERPYGWCMREWQSPSRVASWLFRIDRSSARPVGGLLLLEHCGVWALLAAPLVSFWLTQLGGPSEPELQKIAAPHWIAAAAALVCGAVTYWHLSTAGRRYGLTDVE